MRIGKQCRERLAQPEKEIPGRFLSCIGKQCRERWRNHLRPELNKGDWTVEEDEFSNS